MTRFLIVVEKTRSGYSAYSPDIDGCIASGKTRPAVNKNMQEAIRFHIDGLRLEGFPLPKPRSTSHYVGIATSRQAKSAHRAKPGKKNSLSQEL
ncbi:MAG: type II toxin-antitoxin system HicB family antitoxin [Bacteroidota bacterium]